MSEYDEAKPTNPLLFETVVAFLAAAFSWIIVPRTGIVMHWSIDGVAGWSLGPLGYATVAGVATLLLGHLTTVLVSQKTGFAFTGPAPLAFGVCWVGFAACERFLPGIGAFVAAATIAVAAYFGLMWFLARQTE